MQTSEPMRQPAVRPPDAVGVAMTDTRLRRLLMTHLRRRGFTVFRMRNDRVRAETVVTDHSGPEGRVLTALVDGDIQVTAPDGTWWFPSSDVDRLADVLGAELSRRRRPAA